MSFSLKLVDEYDWPVTVRVPNAGKVEEHQFTARFRHLDLDQVRAMIDEIVAAQNKERGSEQVSAVNAVVDGAQLQIEQAMIYWVGWGDDLTDTEGKPIPYGDETKRKLLGVRIIREALVKAWQDSQSGEAARLGNSDSSPAGGPAAGDR